MYLDPRTKFLTIVVFIAATLTTTNMGGLLAISGIWGIAYFVTQLPLWKYFRNLILLSWLLVITFVVHVWGNRPGAYDGSLTLTQNGLMEGGLALGQLVLVIGWVTILGSSSSPLEIVSGLERLLHPLQRIGLPVQKFSIIVLLSMRFIPILLKEGQHLVYAYVARGIELKQGNIITRLKNSVLLCVPLFHNMIRRVEHLTLAMENRAFQVGITRSSLYELHMRSLDYLILCLSLGVALWIQMIGR